MRRLPSNALADAVDHRRIGLQPHAALQPVDEHRRDQRAVGGACRFPFRRSTRGSALRRVSRAAGRARACSTPPSSRSVIAGRARLSTREVGRALREEIRVRKELALAALLLDRRASRQQLRVRQVEHRASRRPARRAASRFMLGEGRALDDRHRRLRDVALRQLGEQQRQRDAGVDLVAARLDRAVDAAPARQRDERQPDAAARRCRAVRAPPPSAWCRS